MSLKGDITKYGYLFKLSLSKKEEVKGQLKIYLDNTLFNEIEVSDTAYTISFGISNTEKLLRYVGLRDMVILYNLDEESVGKTYKIRGFYVSDEVIEDSYYHKVYCSLGDEEIVSETISIIANEDYLLPRKMKFDANGIVAISLSKGTESFYTYYLNNRKMLSYSLGTNDEQVSNYSLSLEDMYIDSEESLVGLSLALKSEGFISAFSLTFKLIFPVKDVFGINGEYTFAFGVEDA